MTHIHIQFWEAKNLPLDKCNMRELIDSGLEKIAEEDRVEIAIKLNQYNCYNCSGYDPKCPYYTKGKC